MKLKKKFATDKSKQESSDNIETQPNSRRYALKRNIQP